MGWEIDRDADGMPRSLGWVRDDPEAIAAAKVRRKNIVRRRINPAFERWARERGFLAPDEIGNPEAVMTQDEWEAEGRRRFGDDKLDWAFVCPVCDHVATVREYKDAGATHGAVAFSCIGRWAGAKRDAFKGEGPGPCNYSGGGLFTVNPVEVDGGRYFNFADDPETPCDRCGVRDRVDCGYLEETNTTDGREFDCGWPGNEDGHSCDHCRMTNCSTCKEARVNA